MAFYNPTEGLGADLPLSDDDLSAMIGATEDLLRNPAGNERAQANFQRAGQRFFELQDLDSSTLAASTSGSYSNFQESTPSTSSYEYPPPALPAEPLHTQTLYSAATISGEPYPSQQTLMGYHPAASSSDYGGCQGSSSQAMHPGSLKERMEDYAPPNPRKTSRGGFQPSVEKIYDTSEENRLQRRRELGNVACKRHRNRQKETLRNIKAAVMELQNKNDNLRKQKELLGIIRDLYINYMNGC
ncbi:CCAAT/enhancer-binding protein alpha-like isoform X1 [Macrobrachium nipponense]|uniref:CCAAT/enhancer-binding protein alpha-like isoform X1 n=1 Tax=Macrobrachium nipponense TaxID=159736 RepID=UPI0030C8987E